MLGGINMRKWLILIVVLAIGGTIFGTLQERKKTKVIGNALVSSSYIVFGK